LALKTSLMYYEKEPICIIYEAHNNKEPKMENKAHKTIDTIIDYLKENKIENVRDWNEAGVYFVIKNQTEEQAESFKYKMDKKIGGSSHIEVIQFEGSFILNVWGA